MILFLAESCLGTVRVADILSYLRSTGWVERPSSRPGAFLFAGPPADDGEAIVQFVPLSERGRDYPLRVEELLRSLSQFEDRPAADVLWDIVTPDCDRVFFQLERAEPFAGSVELDQGLRLICEARELICQAAAVPVSTRRWRLRNCPGERFAFAIELPFSPPTGDGTAVAPERQWTCSLAEQLAMLEHPLGNGEHPAHPPSSRIAEVVGKLLEAAEGAPLRIRIIPGRSGSEAGPPAREFVFSRTTQDQPARLPAAS